VLCGDQHLLGYQTKSLFLTTLLEPLWDIRD
jgi:hypothetical protein